MFRHLAVLFLKGRSDCLLTAVLGKQLLLLCGGQIREVVRVQAQDHAMGSSLGIRLRAGYCLLVIQELVPESGIQKMQCGMLHTAIVPVYRHPVVQRFFTRQRFRIRRIRIAQEIPGRTCPLRHGIRLSLSRAATAGAGGINPVSHKCQRRLPVVGRHIAVHLRQLQRKFTLVDRHIAAFLTVYDRNRLSPVTLSGEDPVS